MGIINKNKFKKMGLKGVFLLVGALCFFSTSFSGVEAKVTQNEWLNYVVQIGGTYLSQYFSMVHFNVAGNDFGGGILWLPVEQLTGEAVEIKIPTGDTDPSKAYDSVYCSSRVRGLYWNSQRGDNRLWPLDSETHEWLSGHAKIFSKPEWYTDLVFSGGWYTSCSEDQPTATMSLDLDAYGITLSELTTIIETMEKNHTKDRNEWVSNTGEIANILKNDYRLEDEVIIKKIIDAILEGATFEVDPYGIYGRIMHNYDWEQMDLIAGAHYDMDNNRIVKGPLTCSLQRLSNNYPFGYLYDDYGHIGIVGARITADYIQGNAEKKRQNVINFHSGLNYLLNSGICVDQIFGYDGKELKYIIKDMTDDDFPSYEIPGREAPAKNQLYTFLNNTYNGSARTTVFSLGIKGIVGLTDEVKDSQKEYFENNQLESTLMLRTETSISNIVNKVNKKAESLCRGKWNSYPNALQQTTNLVCYSGSASLQAYPSDLVGKDVVIKGANLGLIMNYDNPFNYQAGDSSPINLFIDKGNLFIISSGVVIGNLPCFDELGYRDSNCPEDIKAMYLKGNFVINGLVLGGENGDETVDNRLYIHGKLVSYNTVTAPTATRKRTIEKLLNNTFYPTLPGVSLTNLFTWSCNAVEGVGSDGTSCKGSTGSKAESLLVDKAFGLIDMDLEGDLVKY